MAGAGSTSSSLTSTSHTLTGIAPQPPSAATDAPPVMLAFLDSLKPANRHTFLQPAPSIPVAALQFAKETLDSFAGQVSDEQQQLLLKAQKKRKRGAVDEEIGGPISRADVLKIRKLHIDGFETGQIWQQAKRIISSTLAQSVDTLRELEEQHKVRPAGEDATDVKVLEFGKDGFEVGSDDDVDDDEEEEGSRSSAAGSSTSEDWDGVGEDDEELDMLGEDEEDLEDVEGEEEEEEEDGDEENNEDEDEDEDINGPADAYVEDPNGLNDGFFSIEEFNKQSQWFEDQDARADPNTDRVDDEKEVDWHADPFSMQPTSRRKQSGADDDEDDDDLGEEEEGEDGEDIDDDEEDAKAIFGDQGSGDSDEEMDDDFGDDLGLDLTANDIFYKDFFAPPRRKAKKGARPGKPAEPRAAKPSDADVERAMADIRRDLFEDLSEGGGSDDDGEDGGDLSDVSAGDPRSRRSVHERRQAKLLEEIRKLEAEAVREKKWALSGEVSAGARPVNSLLEEDLDFEQIGKPVPVITPEVTESIEEMVKRRILDQQFDEVIRRHPLSLSADAAAPRRGLVELDDQKAGKGLAEIYEEEHAQNANPDVYVSATDERTRRDEKEVEQMWKELSATLDALSSWHYKPKPAAPALTVVADVATVAMEDAQPATAQGVRGGESALAPQEVYRAAGAGAEKGEVVVAKSGLPVARQEMTREEKLRRRRRQKERIRKGGAGASGAGADGKPAAALGRRAQEKQDTLAQLKRGGVKVINRKGEVLDMEGNKAQAARALTSGSFKL